MDFRTPWDPDPEPAVEPVLPPSPAAAKRRGRRPQSASTVLAAKRPSALAAPTWLHHYLTVSGPATAVAAFAAAARGAGVIPWRLDFTRIEDDVFNLAVARPPTERRLSVAGCRLLARQFRARAEAHHDKAVSLIGRSRACPFDLHALLPVPPAILELGPADPAALAWLREHWGTSERLRHAVERPEATAGRRLPRWHALVGYGFFTAGETPHAATARLAARWPTLRFMLQPRPLD